MVDNAFIRELAEVSLRVAHIAEDRGEISYDVPLNEDTIIQEATRIEQEALAKNKSLGDILSRVFETPSKSLEVFVLDRNEDIAKRRVKMISTDQVKALKDTLNAIDFEPDDQVLVLSPNKWSPQAKKEDFSNVPNFLSLLFDDILIRVPTHELEVPHRKITEDQLLHIAGPHVKPHDLPLILKTDAVVRWFGWPTGTLLLVERPGMLAFRRVVDPEFEVPKTRSHNGDVTPNDKVEFKLL